VNCDVKFGAFLQVLHVMPVPGSERIQDGSYGPKSVGVPLGEHFPQRIFNSDHFKLWWKMVLHDVKFGAFLQVLHVLPSGGQNRSKTDPKVQKSWSVHLGDDFLKRIWNSEHFQFWAKGAKFHILEHHFGSFLS
jgi:hypothetical protein